MVVKITPQKTSPSVVSLPPRQKTHGLKYQIQTLGCHMNYSDSERVVAVLENAGYTEAKTPEETDLFIFNTCSIRQKGEDRVFGTLKRIAGLKNANPRLLIGITGCMVRKTSSRNSTKKDKDDLLRSFKSLDFVFKINDAQHLPTVLTEAEPNLELEIGDTDTQTANEQDEYLRITPKYTSPIQAFVPIQIGCDKFCTYCIVPYARGREKSRSMQDILNECRKLVESGCKEINLVGQTVNSYGLSQADKKNPGFGYYHNIKSGAKPTAPFIKLLQELNALSELGLSRLRYSSPHPRDFTDELIQAHAKLKVLCPHLHLPLQSADNTILERMNRKYTYEDFSEIIHKFRKALPQAAVTTDIIVGFSGETESQFEKNIQAFKDLDWDQAYISRYSERTGTVASKCFPDDISREEKSRRWHKMNDFMKKHSLKKNREYIGKTLELLVENFNQETGEAEGRSRENKVTQFPGNKDQIGTTVLVEITDALEWVLKGQTKS